jgi:hypothetical protein
MTEVCVVHLVWAPLGTGPVERFAASYREHPAGRDHRLVVLLNGFGDEDDVAADLRPLEGLAHETVRIDPPTLDLPAYARAAHALDARYLCFLNSHSTLLAPGWLAALHDALGPGVGLAGATGSYEAPRTINPLRGRRWPRFPNPHIRTNGFILEGALMRSLRWPDVRTKSAAWALESGRAGLTRAVWARGLRTVVVGRDGTAYPPEAWPESATFRSGGQANLLIADNRTRQWEDADPAERARLSRRAWGAAPARAAAQVRAAGRPAETPVAV